ncbi:DUF257 family protein [Thermococcus stetteri]|uniref:DUF257 family protein n=1 Tax=Thermococcus stetteri TaxID=49900 RepID=UPI001AE2C5CB|nr:hypothetical protein [Thermococcus stetteri]
MSIVDLPEFLSAFYPGETVLIEYDTVSMPEVLFYLIFINRENRPMLIDDVADTLCETLTKLEFIGFDISGFKEVPVIKIGGGSRKCGNVFGEVDVDRYSLDIGYYSRIFEKASLNGVVLNHVLGIHKLFLSLERRGAIRLVKNIAMFEGDRRRIAFYFINRDVVETSYPELLLLLEETASTVLNWISDGEKFVLYVSKSANLGIMGKELSFTLDEISSLAQSF